MGKLAFLLISLLIDLLGSPVHNENRVFPSFVTLIDFTKTNSFRRVQLMDFKTNYVKLNIYQLNKLCRKLDLRT